MTAGRFRCYRAGMQLGSWEIGRALGIPIRVHASWFLVFFLVTSSLASGFLPANLPGLSEERYWGMGAVAAVLLFVVLRVLPDESSADVARQRGAALLLAAPMPLVDKLFEGGKIITDAHNRAALDLAHAQSVYRHSVIGFTPPELLVN